MLCTPVFIFTSGSSALLGHPHCGLLIWLSLLVIVNKLHRKKVVSRWSVSGRPTTYRPPTDHILAIFYSIHFLSLCQFFSWENRQNTTIYTQSPPILHDMKMAANGYFFIFFYEKMDKTWENLKSTIFMVSTRWDASKEPQRFSCRCMSLVLGRYVVLDSRLYQFCLQWNYWKYGSLARFLNARSKFVAVSGCLNSEVTQVEVFNTVCHSHRTIVPIQHLHIGTLVIWDALLTLSIRPTVKSQKFREANQMELGFSKGNFRKL